MARALTRQFMRTVTGNVGRFAALAVIVGLGVGFYAGLRMAMPDMKLSADAYFDETRFMDVRVASTAGLAEGDIAALEALDCTQEVMGAYEADVIATLNGKQHTLRIQSLPPSATGGDGAYLNRVVLAQGRLPVSAGECVVSADVVLESAPGIGDVVTVDSATADLDGVLSVRTFEIVGTVHAPNYLESASLGTSTLGSGIVQDYLYVDESAFAADFPVTEAFATVAGARELTYGSDAYEALVSDAVSQIESIAPEREEARLAELRSRAQAAAQEASAQLDAARAQAGEGEAARALADSRVAAVQEAADAIEVPQWLVMDRSKNVGAASFLADADRIDRIARVFPLVLFLVAALVALTSMTRLVDADRQFVGTLKALGFARGRIAAKYLGYALAASGAGSVAGVLLLGKSLPGVIMQAYAIIYYVPSVQLRFDAPIVCLSAGLGVGITVVATACATTACLREGPSLLMLPRAPEPGRRIALERIGALWGRLPFSWKVTLRNAFRYKRRFLMTLFGIAGCTALMLTGFGLHDSVNDILDIQYTELIHFNAQVTREDDASVDQIGAIEAQVRGEGAVQAASAWRQTYIAEDDGGAGHRLELVVPSDPQAFAALWTMRTRVGHEPVELDADSVILDEKLAGILGVGVGDVVALHEQDLLGNATDETHELTVTGIVENYIYDYAFVGSAAFERAFGGQPAYTTWYVRTSADDSARQAFDEALAGLPGVKTLAYNDETIAAYRSMLRSVDLVVAVLVAAAVLLAYIVLYSLASIDIEERRREIATLRVLGFTKGETSSYVLREMAVTVVLGCLAGLVLGVALEGFVVVSAEADQVMFGRQIHAGSFALSFALTVLFSAGSLASMRGKVARIDMVESLKSVQ